MGCLLIHADPGSIPQPEYVPWLESNLQTFGPRDNAPNNWVTPARAECLTLNTRKLVTVFWFLPGRVPQLVRASSYTPKGCTFDSWSGHIPRLRVWSQVGVHTGSNWSMFFSHIDVYLSLSLKNSMNISLGEDLKKKETLLIDYKMYTNFRSI